MTKRLGLAARIEEAKKRRAAEPRRGWGSRLRPIPIGKYAFTPEELPVYFGLGEPIRFGKTLLGTVADLVRKHAGEGA